MMRAPVRSTRLRTLWTEMCVTKGATKVVLEALLEAQRAWSEKKGETKTSVDYLSSAIPDFNYGITWECDIKKRDKGIIKYTMPEAEDQVTEEVIVTEKDD